MTVTVMVVNGDLPDDANDSTNSASDVIVTNSCLWCYASTGQRPRLRLRLCLVRVAAVGPQQEGASA